MIDKTGKVFGFINVIDLSFIIVLFAMLSGLLWVRLGTTPIEQKILASGTAEFEVAIRGARVKEPSIFKEGEKAFLTIRNQRYQEIEIIKVMTRKRQIAFMNPQGQVVAVDDPTAQDVHDIDITFRQTAEMTEKGLLMGGHYLKVGNPIEIDALNYILNGSIVHAKLL